MLWYRKRKRFDGEMLWIYFLGYGVGRFWIEGLRTDQLKVPGTALAVSQLLSATLAGAAVGALTYHYKKLSKKKYKIHIWIKRGRQEAKAVVCLSFFQKIPSLF